MWQIVEDIMEDIKAISYYMYHNWHWKDIEVVGFLPLEKLLQKHLEPQKKAEKMKHQTFYLWDWTISWYDIILQTKVFTWQKIKSEPQQEDKKIEMVEFKYMDMNSYNTPNSIVWNLREIEKKINEIITYLNNR